jgi:pimeloyl-ACP methyl ester carboxylesterase
MCAGYQGTLHLLPEIYSRIRCPALILWSENEKHFPLIHAENLHAAIPHSLLQKIPNGTHWVFYADPEIVFSCLQPFLD